MKKIKFGQNDSRVNKIIKRIREGTATEAMLEEVALDLERHLALECGTMDNYVGLFGKETINIMRRKYPCCLNWEALDGVKDKKIQTIMDTILARFNDNECIRMSPVYVNIVTNYLRGLEDVDSVSANNVVVVGYPQADSGVRTKPLPKK